MNARTGPSPTAAIHSYDFIGVVQQAVENVASGTGDHQDPTARLDLEQVAVDPRILSQQAL